MERSKNIIRPISVAISGMIWLSAFASEGIAMFLTVSRLSNNSPLTSFLMPLFFHAGAALLLFLVPLIYSGKGWGAVRFYAHLSGWLTLLLPPLGIVGSSLSLFWAKKLLKEKGIVEEYEQYTSYVPDEKELLEEIPNPEAFLQDELSVEPILDIFAGEDEVLKKGAVNLLGRIGTPGAIRLLKIGLTDSSTEVRFIAHSTLGKLDESRVKRIQEAQARLDSGKGHRADHLKELGKAYCEYAGSGLLEDETKDHYLNLGREAYVDALSEAPDDPETVQTLGQLSADRKEFEDAERYFKKTLETASNRVDSLIGLCRIYYDKGDLNQLAEVVKQIKQIKGQKSEDVTNNILMEFWARPQEAH